MNIGSMSCCGFKEIQNLSVGGSSEEHMRTFCKHFNWDRSRWPHRQLTTLLKVGQLSVSHAVFTATSRAKYGRAFAAYITEYGLGELVCSTLSKNPNSGNKIQGWIWTVDREALCKWYNTHRNVKKG